MRTNLIVWPTVSKVSGLRNVFFLISDAITIIIKQDESPLQQVCRIVENVNILI